MHLLPWESIKKDYEEQGLNPGILSKKYNCASVTIYNRASAEKWIKPTIGIDIKKYEVDPIPTSTDDLPDEKKEDDDEQEESANEVDTEKDKEEEKQEVEFDIDQLTIENAIYRQKCILARLMHELEVTTSHIGQMKKWIIEGTKDDRSITRRRAMVQAVSMGNRAVMLKNAAAALKTLCEIEGMSGIKPRGKKATIEAEAQALSKQIFETPDMPGNIAA